MGTRSPAVLVSGTLSGPDGPRHSISSAFARIALEALAVAAFLAIATYAITCRRSFASVLENGRTPSQQPILTAILAFLDLFAWRAAAFERACHHFIVRAMLRSESHRMCIAVAAGLGWLIALAQLGGDETSQLEAPLSVAYMIILGLRIAYELPANVPANWVFRATLGMPASREFGAPLRVMLGFVVPVAVLPAFLLAWRQWGAPAAILQALYVLALSILLGAVLLVDYHKIPLTCPMPAFRDNFLALCVIQMLGFALFTGFGARLGSQILRHSWYFALVPPALYAAWYANGRGIADAREAGELEESWMFENTQAPAIQRLDLFDAG